MARSDRYSFRQSISVARGFGRRKLHNAFAFSVVLDIVCMVGISVLVVGNGNTGSALDARRDGGIVWYLLEKAVAV